MRKAYFQLHLAVLLWGFTGIFGKLISLNELWLVWYRMILSALALGLYLRLQRALHWPDRKTFYKASAIGVVICLHWITFYGSIKASNVSVAMSCFSSLALFTALLDPLINRKKLHLPEIILGLAVIGGISIIAAAQQFYIKGIVLAIISAMLAALFSIFNKQLYDKDDPATVTVIELGSGFLFLTCCIPFFGESGIPMPSSKDWLWLLLLSIFCTSLAFTLGNIALQKLDAFTCNLTVNLEPVYTIILAIIIFQEGKILNSGFYAGTAILLASVVFHTIYKFRLSKKK
jgi:drug/metabolite transporter (DMT)-like permease